MKAVQLFSDEALERGKQMSTEEIVRFLDEFRRMHGNHEDQKTADSEYAIGSEKHESSE